MAVKNSLVSRQGKLDFSVYLTQDAAKQQINKLLGGKVGPRFISALVSAVQANPALQECTNPSLLNAALLGESLNLSPSPQLGQYYMVPYDNSNKGKEAQFQLGYKGYIQLAIRSGQYKKLNVLSIKEGELIRFDPLNEEIEVNLIQNEEQREAAPTIGYYAMFEYTNGFRKAMYWSKAKMEAHAKKYSPGYKWGIMSIELQTAIDSDMAVIREDGSRDYVETVQPDAVEEAAVPQEENAAVQEDDAAQETNDAAADFFS